MKIADKLILSLTDKVLHEGRIALLCNQTSWDFTEGAYLFELLHRRGTLHRIFIPEHGLFAELQDQEALESGEFYKCLGLEGVDFVSLYGHSESSLSAPLDKLRDLDAIIIDLQDVGCRYYTFISTVDKLFRSLSENSLAPAIYVIDRPSPTGRQVEGTLIGKEYTSFIGVEGLIHRHGLTFGELCGLLHSRYNAKFPLIVIPYTLDDKYTTSYILPGAGASYVKTPCSIYPSPNLPSPYTCLFYSGQCLFEGTNLSEGRGTTRPFEIFGAPFLNTLHYYNSKNGYSGWNDRQNPIYDKGAMLRILHYIPTFHKYAGELCYGFQLHLTGKPYHSLSHTLRILRFLHDNMNGFAWRDGVYEKGNDKTAIELLVGDILLLDYLNGKATETEMLQALAEGEEAWIKTATEYTIYPEKFIRVLLY
ncbi:MAG: DUF1343 domain-containing protein [Prevotellaceae bacterium]|jgi:uncharacterized protein YbbC (DUF1343 family)|nr:DUF1343 domain-containing protein [Prevotellaceae bacterium]